MTKLPHKFFVTSQSVLIEAPVSELPPQLHTLADGSVQCIWACDTRWANVLLSRDQAIELRNALDDELGHNIGIINKRSDREPRAQTGHGSLVGGANAEHKGRSPMSTFSPALEEVMLGAEAAAAAQPNMLTVLVDTLNAVIPSVADPYLLSAALIEAVARTMVQKIPLARQGEVSVEVVRLLRDRLRAHGAILEPECLN